MLSPTDSWDLMTAIKHLDHRSATPEDARLFAQIINDACDPTLGECLSAVARWFGTHHDFGMIQPGDVADIVRANRPASHLTENQITDMLIARGLEGDALWAGGAPAMVRRLVNSGVPLADAVGRAADRYRGRELEPPARRARHPMGHHFIASMSKTRLADVLPGEHDKPEQ